MVVYRTQYNGGICCKVAFFCLNSIWHHHFRASWHFSTFSSTIITAPICALQQSLIKLKKKSKKRVLINPIQQKIWRFQNAFFVYYKKNKLLKLNSILHKTCCIFIKMFQKFHPSTAYGVQVTFHFAHEICLFGSIDGVFDVANEKSDCIKILSRPESEAIGAKTITTGTANFLVKWLGIFGGSIAEFEKNIFRKVCTKVSFL